MIHFEVECHTVVGQMVAVVGTGPLGGWDVKYGLVLEPEQYPVWRGYVNGAPFGALDFKYVLVDASGSLPSLIRWETDGPPNRRVDPNGEHAESVTLHHIFGDQSGGYMEVVPATDRLESVQLFPEDKEPSTDVPDEASPLPSARGRSPQSASGESVLEYMQVGPGVRFGRFSHEPGAFEAKYSLRDSVVLGSGVSGGVITAVSKSSGSKVAVKTLCTDGLVGEQLARVRAEVENQLMMDNHPNICRLLEVFEEPGRLRLVMERMRGPDLFDRLSWNGRYTERDAAGCVRQMTAAVAYCHRHGVCHRDLKLENFCLEDDSLDARVKLIDFGLSSVVDINVPLTNACGTLYYVAPEVLSQSYGKKCDVWSLGVITYILLDGRPPFSGRDDKATYKLIKAGIYHFPKDRWHHISEQAKDFVASLLKVDVSKRLDAAAAMAHPWLADVVAGGEPRPLDAAVLESLRNFSKSNALKRGVLRAVTPVATIERVAVWADHFEALDHDGSGKVGIQDLARRLAECGGLTNVEAAELSGLLAEAGGSGDYVSYSAFLAACLSAHVNLGDQQLRDLFRRLDTEQRGTVSTEDVCRVLGDLVDVETLQGELEGKELTYSEFRWLMSMPRLGPTILGLRQLLGACGSLCSAWKLSTRRARKASNDDEALDAARRENMAWRVMFQQAQKGEGMQQEPSPMLRQSQIALSMESVLLSGGSRSRDDLAGLTQEEKRALVIDSLSSKTMGTRRELEALSDEQLVGMFAAASPKTPGAGQSFEFTHAMEVGPPPACMARTPTLVLVNCEADAQDCWQSAATAAKEGCVESARRENMLWRKMHVLSKKSPGSTRHTSPASSEK